MKFTVLIKSHLDFPDIEASVSAANSEEAVNKFYELFKGEYDKDFIRSNMEASYSPLSEYYDFEYLLNLTEDITQNIEDLKMWSIYNEDLLFDQIENMGVLYLLIKTYLLTEAKKGGDENDR